MPLPCLSNFHHPEMEQKKTIIFIFMAHSNRYNNCHSMTTSNLQRLILNQNEMTTKRMKEPKNQRRTNESTFEMELHLSGRFYVGPNTSQ